MNAAGGGLKAHFTGRLQGFRLDAAFVAAPRGVTALTGPSGSGKTTVLRCIAGLARMKGSLTLDGEVWQDGGRFLPPHRRAVGMVFQEASLLAHLSVRDNLLYGQRRSRTAPVVAQGEAVDLLGLGGLMTRSTANLSGGERQRVAIGRALLSQPRLLLMDEPVSNLDADSRAEILAYLDRLHRTLAIPIVYVSHDLAEVKRLADHVLVMREGRIVEAIDQATDAAWRSAAQAQLDALDGDRVRRLAMAALLAGLDGA